MAGRLGLDWGWYGRNRVLVWICVLIAVNQLGFGSIVPVVPLYALAYGVPQSAIGLAIAIYGLARFLLSVPGGQLADRVGRRSTLAIGGLLTAAGSLLCALAPTYFPFLVGRFVAGSGAALVLTAGQIVMADITTPERRGRVMSIYFGVFLFSVGVGPYPGGLLAEQLGLGAPFYAAAASGLAAAVVAWLWLPETRGLRPDGAAAEKARPPFRQQLRILTTQRGFLLVSLTSFSAAVVRAGGIFSLIPVLGQQRLGLSADQIGLGLALTSLIGLVLTYPSGVLVDRFGRKTVIVPSMLLTGLSLGCFLVASSLAGFLAGCIAWGIAIGISGPAPAAYAADIAPPGMNAAAMGAFRMMSDAGYVVGPLVLGVLADLSGVDAALLGTAALLVVVGLLFAWLAPETYHRTAPVA